MVKEITRRVLYNPNCLTPDEVSYDGITHLFLPPHIFKQQDLMDTNIISDNQELQVATDTVIADGSYEIMTTSDIVPDNTKTILTEQQELFLEAYFDPRFGGDAELAKQVAGYSENTSVYYLMTKLSDEIANRTSKFLAFHGPKAAMKLIDALNNPLAKGTKEMIAASREVLDRGGVIKKEQIEVKTDQPMNVVVLPPKQQHS
jgi:hypothetical protein